MNDRRLLCVASMVREGASLADIGTDHAYLPTYLMQCGRIRFAVAADIGEGPAASARHTVETAGLSDRIDVRVCDGLTGLSPDEVTDIVIAGMGGETIIHILGEAPWVKNEAIRLVLQPMTKSVELRSWLYQNGFVIDEEHVIPDGHHLYCAMRAHFEDAAAPKDPAAPYIGALVNDDRSRPYFQQQQLYLDKKLRGLMLSGKTEEWKALLPIIKTLSMYTKERDNMTVCHITDFMETLAPRALAEEWDNVGLLVGDPEAVVDTLVVTLDITPEAIAFAEEVGAQMIVAHHPLIFSPVKHIVAPSTLHQLVTSGIAAFAAHTNLDAAVGGVNDTLAQTIGLVDVKEAFGGIGRVGVLPTSMEPTAFAAMVGKKLHTSVQLREGTQEIRTVALVGGAGGDYACGAQADAFLTGEIKHHEWLDLPPALTVVAAGHYATENVVVAPLCEKLTAAFPSVRVCPFSGTAPYRTI